MKTCKHAAFLASGEQERRDPHPLPAKAAHLARKVVHQALAALGGNEMSPAHALRALMAATLSCAATTMTRADIADWLWRISLELRVDEKGLDPRVKRHCPIKGANQ